MKRNFFILIFCVFLLQTSYGQSGEKVYVYARIIDGDTLPLITLSEVNIEATILFKNQREYRKYSRLVRHVKKVYPYARLAGIKLLEYDRLLAGVESEKERKRIMKQAEDELKEEFGDELKQLTFTQGKILLKLVDRETGTTSYDVVQELRGKFAAFFWQSIARIFGYNLKVKYDPLFEDREIELIVRMIESGKI